jgi:hypothetical protein
MERAGVFSLFFLFSFLFSRRWNKAYLCERILLRRTRLRLVCLVCLSARFLSTFPRHSETELV